MSGKVYIRSMAQISIQKPLSDEWMKEPIEYASGMHRCIDPDFRQFFSPMQARRMGSLVKRAIAVSRTVMKESGIENPDAIMTGTGLGCIENTEKFLDPLSEGDLTRLSPTNFMLSTHNTIGSSIAIDAKCHGCNCTYTQEDFSFENALLDAFAQIVSGRIHNALVGCHDELTETAYDLMRKSGYYDSNDIASEGSVAMMLTDSPDNAICEVADVDIFINNSAVGGFGSENVVRTCDYFRLFGKGFSSSALAAYAAARQIAEGRYSEMVLANDLGRGTGVIILKGLCGN